MTAMSATVVVLLASICCCVVAETRKLPNIVFVLADDLGYADIGYHGGGYQDIRTPVLDQLAYDGVRLENYYVQPACSPTRGALLSGRLPIHTGLQHLVIDPGQPKALPLNLAILPQMLKTQGYSTHMVGKWHLGMHKKEYLPTSRGFDTFYGFYQGGEDYFNHTICGGGTSPGTGQYCGIDLHNDTTPDFNKTGQYSATLFAEEAVRLIHKKKDDSAPMFMYLPFQNVHTPQQAPESYINQYKSIQNLQRRVLAAQIAILDEAVGNITDALKFTGRWENTVFIFSSDNGGPTPVLNSVGCNYPLRGSKGTLWEGGTRVAGFIGGPLAPALDSVYNGTMHISDWYPTILSVAGVQIPKGMILDGFNQWPAISQAKSSPRTELLYNIDPLAMKYGESKPGSPFDNRIQAALRVGDYKIITGMVFGDGWYKPVYSEGDVQKEEFLEYQSLIRMTFGFNSAYKTQNIFLFNITADPYEMNDLSQELPEVVDMMLGKLSIYYKGMVPPQDPIPDMRHADPSKHGGSWEPWM